MPFFEEVHHADILEGTKKTPITGHKQKVTSAQYSPDGTRLLTGSKDGTVRMWHVSSANRFATYETKADVARARWKPRENQAFASCSSTAEQVKIWDTRQTADAVSSIATGQRNLHLAWAPDGNYIYLGSVRDRVSVVDVRSEAIVKRYDNTQQVNEFAFGPVSNDLYSTLGSYVTAERSTGKIESPRISTLNCSTLDIDPQEDFVVVGTNLGTTTFLDAHNLHWTHSTAYGRGAVKTVRVSLDGSLVGVCHDDGSVYFVDTQTHGRVGSVTLASTCTDIAWHPSGTHIVLAGDVDERSRGSCLIIEQPQGGDGEKEKHEALVEEAVPLARPSAASAVPPRAGAVPPRRMPGGRPPWDEGPVRSSGKGRRDAGGPAIRGGGPRGASWRGGGGGGGGARRGDRHR